MINFMCQPQGAEIKYYFWVCLRVFHMRLAFESMDSVKQITFPNMGGHHPIPQGPE